MLEVRQLILRSLSQELKTSWYINQVHLSSSLSSLRLICTSNPSRFSVSWVFKQGWNCGVERAICHLISYHALFIWLILIWVLSIALWHFLCIGEDFHLGKWWLVFNEFFQDKSMKHILCGTPFTFLDSHEEVIEFMIFSKKTIFNSYSSTIMKCSFMTLKGEKTMSSFFLFLLPKQCLLTTFYIKFDWWVFVWLTDTSYHWPLYQFGWKISLSWSHRTAVFCLICLIPCAETLNRSLLNGMKGSPSMIALTQPRFKVPQNLSAVSTIALLAL